MDSLPEKYNALITYGRGKECKVEEIPLQRPAKNQVLVKVAFAPVNPADIYTTLGAYPVPVSPPHGVGIEGSGTVVATGEDLKVPHQVGDRVHIYSVGTYSQYVLTDSENVRKIKGDLPFETAASHFVNPATVGCMGDIVRKGGHKTVVHTAGTSALGRMLIRYFKHKGIKTINIVRKDEYIEDLKKDGADYVLNSGASDFEKQFREIAHKEEATVAFDAVAGSLTTQILKNQPKGSQCYIYGSLGGAKISDLYIQTFIFEGKTLSGLWLTEYLERARKTGEAEKLLDEVYDLLPNVLNSNVQKVYKLEEWKDAIAYHKDNSSKGKILIQPN